MIPEAPSDIYEVFFRSFSRDIIQKFSRLLSQFLPELTLSFLTGFTKFEPKFVVIFLAGLMQRFLQRFLQIVHQELHLAFILDIFFSRFFSGLERGLQILQLAVHVLEMNYFVMHLFTVGKEYTLKLVENSIFHAIFEYNNFILKYYFPY